MRRHLVFTAFAAVTLILFSLPAQAQNPFEEIGAEIGLTEEGQAGCPRWFDFDGDGDLDLLRTDRFYGPVKLYINAGGQFNELENSGLPVETDIQSAVPTDFDRDGDIDIFLGGYSSELQFMVNENGHFVNRAEELGIEVNLFVRDYIWMDLDGDGWLDLIIQFESYWKLYRNVEGESFEDITEQSQLPNTNANAMFAIDDYDLDSDLDIFMPRIHGSDYFFRNEGNGVFTDVTEETRLDESAANAGCVFVDVNNDKYPDLVAPGDGHHDVWLNQGGQYFIQATVHGAACDFEEMDFPWGARYAAGDYDMDGDYDFMVCCPGGTGYNEGENQFLRCDSIIGNEIWFTNTAPEWDMNTMLDGLPRFADYDADGDLDLTILQTDTHPLLYRNTTNQPGRLEVRVLGPNDEEFAWNRRVEVYPHAQQVALKSGLLSQDAVASSGLNSYFTLNDNAAYDLKIYLENGATLTPETNPELGNVVPSAIGHKLVVHLDGGSAVDPKPPVAHEFILHPAFPNPFNPTTRIAFDLALAGNVQFRVYNITGAEVAVVKLGSLSAGSHSFDWNASALSSGVYFGKIEAGTFTATQKLVLLK